MSIRLMPLHAQPRVFGHNILDMRLCSWVGFGYRRFACGYRNWITTDFQLRLGFVVVDGWIP